MKPQIGVQIAIAWILLGAWIAVAPNAAAANTVLLLHMDGASNEFVDSSASRHPVVTQGAATQSAAVSSPLNGGNRVGEFPGSAAHLELADSDDWDFSSNTFTIDFWYRSTAISDRDRILTQYSNTNGIQYSLIQFHQANNKPDRLYVSFYNNGAETQLDVSGLGLDNDRWYHVALVREGATLSAYIDGALVHTAAEDPGSYVNIDAPLKIGGDGTVPHQGYLEEMRITQGLARWTSDFTPPAEPDADTVLLLHMDGASNEFVDSSASRHPVVTQGAATQSAAVSSPLNGGNRVGEFPGSAAHLELADSDDWDFSSNTFTIDFWYRSTAISDRDRILTQYSNTNGIQYSLIQFHQANNKPDRLYVSFYNNGAETQLDVSGLGLDNDRWYHVALVREGATLSAYIDGALVHTAAEDPGSYVNIDAPLKIGGDGTVPHQGYLEEMRITQGLARWTSDFTPPFLPDGTAPTNVPTAHAGSDVSIHAGDTAVLDGGMSFDDDTPTEDLDYYWTLASSPAGSAAALDDPTSTTPTILCDLPGTYVVQLVVTDGSSLLSMPDTVQISSTNILPTADAGSDQAVLVGDVVNLDGLGSSDPEWDPLTYTWTLASAPQGSTAQLLGPYSVAPTFVPDVPGTYIASLVVNDGFDDSAPSATTVSAVSLEFYAETRIADALNDIAALPIGSVTTQGNQKALTNFLSQALELLSKGRIVRALSKLTSAIERTDGCAIRGAVDGNGPGRDWITNCGDQTLVYTNLQAAVDALTE